MPNLDTRRPDVTAERPDRPNWEGLTDIAGHRTVGPHRAWHTCGEWCAPGALCPCCDQTRVPSTWRGLHPGELLDALRRRLTSLPEQVSKQQILAILEGRDTEDFSHSHTQPDTEPEETAP